MNHDIGGQPQPIEAFYLTEKAHFQKLASSENKIERLRRNIVSRDRQSPNFFQSQSIVDTSPLSPAIKSFPLHAACLLYTSDAADD